MNLLSLNEIKMYNELEERKTNNAKEYAGLLIPIVKDMDGLLAYIKNLFPEYPDHGLQHSLRILNYISEILTETEMKSMSDSEIFSFILAALFHDAGMALYNHENFVGIRKEHPEYAPIVLDAYFDNQLKILENRDRFKAAIKFACCAHGMSIPTLYEHEEFHKKDRIKNDQIRYSLLAILLRIGDLMDLEGDRTNPFLVEYFAQTFPQESLEHHLRHLHVILYDYSPEEINVEVCAKSIEQYRIWKKWFSYMNDEILQANTFLKKHNFFFPLPKTVIKNGGNYQVEDIRFEIDETGGIWKIISQSIYTDELDFLRELVQNSIDASLARIYRNANIKLKHKSPRSWETKKYCDDIFVGYSEKNNYLLVCDAGIGMNQEDLKRFLFRISGTGDFSTAKRKFSFPSIASFGIGFISCLLNATRIEIYTRKKGDNGCKVSLEEGSNLAFLQKFDSKNFVGTTIKLNLKQQFTYNNIELYVRDKFVYPSVNIVCFNIDELEKVSKELNMLEELQEAIEKSYNFVSIYKTFEEKRKPIIQHNIEQYNILRELELDAEKLTDWLGDNAEYDEKISDKEKLLQFKAQILKLFETNSKLNEKLKIPFIVNEITEKTLFVDLDKYIQKLEEYRRSEYSGLLYTTCPEFGNHHSGVWVPLIPA